jgi:hypothetical protein
MTFKPGDPVIVSFDGQDCVGEVILHSHTGFVMAQVNLPDPEMDFGKISSQLDPQPTLCVRETHVRPAETLPEK